MSTLTLAAPRSTASGLRDDILVVEGVSKRFGGRIALDAASLEVRAARSPGDRPQRLGQSTLFNIVAGALPPDGGRVRINGRDTTGTGRQRSAVRGSGGPSRSAGSSPR